jgi:hypothetical protein
MMKEIDESILRKVRKALALAGNNPSEQEAQTAMLMAQRIMAQYGLSIGDVEVHQDQHKRNVVHKAATEYRKNRWWKKRLSAIIAENFRCYSYNNHRGGASQIRFIGLESDVALAIEVFNYACEAIQYHSTKYRQEMKNRGHYRDVNRMVNDYLNGYLSGLHQKFKEQVQQNNWGLVLVKDALVVKERERMKMKSAPAVKAHFGQDADSFLRGFEDGKKFDSNRKLIAEH